MLGLRGRGKVKRSGFLFAFSVLFLLSMQGWLAKYHAIDFAELPPESAEMVESSNGVTAALGVAPHALSSEQQWVRSRWMPDTFDRKFYQLATARQGAISTGGNSLIDAAVQFHSAQEFFWYLPRALQVGLLSPLPELWGGKGSTPAMTLARKVVGVVTAFFYVCLIGLLAGLFIFKRNLGFWVMMVFCLLGILVYTFTYPNVGTLMRYRYGFYMMLISFGAAVIAEQTLNWRENRRHNG